MYHELVYHLDLCVYAYQIYNQTLIWPLDPYYERWNLAKAKRRANVMAKAHSYFAKKTNYRGPGSTREWTNNLGLDPIMARYDRINPWLPCFTRDDANYRLFHVPDYITSRISTAYMCEYSVEPRLLTSTQIDLASGKPYISCEVKSNNNGTDVLYCFEGGSGATSTQAPAWSLFGFVLQRDLGSNGDYDVHIVFRGSQSGSGTRAMAAGKLYGTGNPDWVTDMDNRWLVGDARVTNTGQVCAGFFRCAVLSFNTLYHVFIEISKNRNKKPPKQIWITGHSLGGALAAQLASALVLGTYGKEIKKHSELKSWPWDLLKLITYGAPPVGGKNWSRALNKSINGQRVRIYADFVTSAPTQYHVGAEIRLIGKYGSKLTSMSKVAHGVPAIRAEVINYIKEQKQSLTNVPAQDPKSEEQPWKYYKNFLDMVDDDSTVKDHLRLILGDTFVDEMDQLLQIIPDAIAMDGSSVKALTKQQASDRQKKLQSAFDEEARQGRRVGQLLQMASKKQVLNDLKGRIEALQGFQGSDTTVERYLGLCILLCDLMDYPKLKLTQLAEDQTLNACLTV